MPQIQIPQPQVQDIYSFGFDKNLNKVRDVSGRSAYGASSLNAQIGGIFSGATLENCLISDSLIFDNSLYNIPIGRNALNLKVTGNNNIAIGQDALSNVTTGNNNIAIGQDAGVSDPTFINTVALGKGAVAHYSNAMIVGGTGTDAIKIIQFGADTGGMAIIPISQAQSLTVSRLTISGIANNEAGTITCTLGGNVGAIDRASKRKDFSYLKDSGTVLFSTASAEYGVTGGATAADFDVVVVNSGGVIVVQTTTVGFGAGAFVGALFVTVTKNGSGLILTP